MEEQKFVVEVNAENRNHHLWRNNGTWWVHYTMHLPDYTKQRVRLSLETKCVNQARLRRDALFRQLNGGPCHDVTFPMRLAA